MRTDRGPPTVTGVAVATAEAAGRPVGTRVASAVERRCALAPRRIGLGLMLAAAAVVGAVASWTLDPVLTLGWSVIAGVGIGIVWRTARQWSRDRHAPDPLAAAHVDRVLADLDRVEHRRVELGTPWPLVSVGPNGVSVVDVCPPPPRRPAGRCAGGWRRGDRAIAARVQRLTTAGRSVERTLRAAGLELPVRTVAVRLSTPDHPGPGRDDSEVVIDLDRLPQVLAEGPIVAMPVVDAAFTSLTRGVVPVAGSR